MDEENRIQEPQAGEPTSSNTGLYVILGVMILIAAVVIAYLVFKPQISGAPSSGTEGTAQEQSAGQGDPKDPPAGVTLTGPAVYEFYTDWCPACKTMKPIVESVKPKYEDSIDFKLYNIESSPEGSDLSEKLGVYYIPAFYLVDEDGKIVDSWDGALSKEAFEAKLHELK